LVENILSSGLGPVIGFCAYVCYELTTIAMYIISIQRKASLEFKMNQTLIVLLKILLAINTSYLIYMIVAAIFGTSTEINLFPDDNILRLHIVVGLEELKDISFLLISIRVRNFQKSKSKF
jgi:hypothetical protein